MSISVYSGASALLAKIVGADRYQMGGTDGLVLSLDTAPKSSYRRQWLVTKADKACGLSLVYSGQMSNVLMLFGSPAGTLAVFNSNEIEHEVLDTFAPRLVVAGWWHSYTRGARLRRIARRLRSIVLTPRIRDDHVAI